MLLAAVYFIVVSVLEIKYEVFALDSSRVRNKINEIMLKLKH